MWGMLEFLATLEAVGLTQSSNQSSNFDVGGNISMIIEGIAVTCGADIDDSHRMNLHDLLLID